MPAQNKSSSALLDALKDDTRLDRMIRKALSWLPPEAEEVTVDDIAQFGEAVPEEDPEAQSLTLSPEQVESMLGLLERTAPQAECRLTPEEFMEALLTLEPVGTREWSVPIRGDDWAEPMTFDDLAGDALEETTPRAEASGRHTAAGGAT